MLKGKGGKKKGKAKGKVELRFVVDTHGRDGLMGKVPSSNFDSKSLSLESKQGCLTP